MESAHEFVGHAIRFGDEASARLLPTVTTPRFSIASNF
jgi:hypothetical protein